MQFKDPRLVLICAFRYALGRQTYMPGVIVDELKRNWGNLVPNDRSRIKEEICFAIESGSAGDERDEDMWAQVLLWD